MTRPTAFDRTDSDAPTIRDGFKIECRVAGLFVATGDDFVTAPTDTLDLTFEGISGDYHSGATRLSGGREPWYPRGTEIRNERQLSLLSTDDLRTYAHRLDIPELKSEWIGGNILLEGISSFSFLPPRSLLFFDNGVTVKIDGNNGPCRIAGRSVASHYPDRPDIELGFAEVGRGLRGLVGWVEKPGRITSGESLTIMIPPQWIYGD